MVSACTRTDNARFLKDKEKATLFKLKETFDLLVEVNGMPSMVVSGRLKQHRNIRELLPGTSKAWSKLNKLKPIWLAPNDAGK